MSIPRPAPALGLAQALSRRASRDPQWPAITFDGETWSYGELQRRVETAAAGLAALGVRRGDRIGYLAFNDSEFFVALHATARLGAIFVPLNFRLSATEHLAIVRDAGISVLLVDGHHRAVIEPVRAELGCRHCIALNQDAPGWDSHALLRDASLPPTTEVDTAPDDVAVIMYTSGTTGRPKGVILTHGNLWTNSLNVVLTLGVRGGDVGLNFAPMFHVGGLCVISLPLLLMGGHLIQQRAFDATEVMRAIARYRVTVTFAVPAMILFMSQHPDFEAADLSSLRMIAVGGAPVPEPLLKLYAERGIPVHQGYGMTETAATLCFLSPERSQDKLGSCGKPTTMTEMRLVGFDGQLITQAHQKGEIRARGANVTPGYWNRPEETRAAFDEEGWLRTGDIGYVDEDGYLTICDRLKDMIISGGENVYPAEIESVLFGHPAVAEVAIIGAPDERWGERVVAVVALKANASLTLDELRAFAEKSLARYKLPRELRLVDALPRNPSGKVLKVQLRADKAA